MSKSESSRSQVAVKVLIFKLRKYKLNYLFKYSQSVVESSSIIITKPT